MIQWDKIKEIKDVNCTEERCFSIIVPFRNEEENISELVNSLKNLVYEKKNYELIFIDDSSEDKGWELLSELISAESNYRIISNSRSDGKKGALSSGISLSNYQYIITIDADCVVPKNLLKSYSNKLNEDEYDFISGPVQYEGVGFVSSILNFELFGLVMVGASSIENGTPNMTNGANLCFSKSSFEKVSGYQDNKDFASGDDEFLLQKISRLKDSKIGFLKSQDAIVITKKPQSFGSYINQRLRWGSKWRYYKSTSQKIAPIFIFALYLLQIINYFQGEYTHIFGCLLGTKILIEAIFMLKVLKFYKQIHLIVNTIITQLYYPFYVVFIALISLVKTDYVWKKRIVK